jgi:hypothetical protein
MRILATTVSCLFLSPIVFGECVTVESAKLPFQPSSQKVRITAMLDGKPLKDARIGFFLTKEYETHLWLVTDEQGIVTSPLLQPGQYHVVAMSSEGRFAEIYLDVSKGAGNVASAFLMDLTPKAPTLAERKSLAALVEKTPVTEHVRKFTGVVEDPSGAVIPEADIQIFQKGKEGDAVVTLKADKEGRFSVPLADGVYVAFLRMQGFRTEAVGFEIAGSASVKDVRISMLIGWC